MLKVAELVGILGLDSGPFDEGLEGAGEKLEGFGSKGKLIAGGIGLGIAGALGASLAGAMDLEAANDKVAAQLGLTEDEAARIGTIAGDVYADNYGESMEQVNDAAAAVWSTFEGQSDAATQKATQDALNIAAAYDIDVARAVESAGNLMRSGLAKDSAEANDLIVAGLQNLPAALREDLLDATDEYSQFFASIGFSGTEAMNALVAASDKGMYGIDKTGDAIKEFGIRATDMSTASKVGFDALGLSQQEMTDKLLAGGDTARGAFDQIIDGLLAIKEPSAQSQAALALFGTPLEDLNTTEIPGFLTGLQGMGDGLGEVSGAADRFGSTLSGNASSTIEMWKRRASQAFVTLLGGQILPLIEQGASWLQDKLGPAVSDVAEWFADNLVPALQDGADLLGDELGPAVSTVATFLQDDLGPPLQDIAGWVANDVVPALQDFVTWLDGSTGGATALKAVIVGLGAAFLAYKLVMLGTAIASAALTLATNGMILVTRAYVATQWLLNAAMTANPIGIVVLALVALAAGLYYAWTHSEKFREIVTAVWDKVWAGAVWMKDRIVDAFWAVVNWLVGFPGMVSEKVSGFLDFIVREAGEIKDDAIGVMVSFAEWYVGLPGLLASKAFGLFNFIVRWAKDAAVNAWNAIIDTFTFGQGSPMNDAGTGYDTSGGFTMAEGGVVTGAQIHMIGEAGPEAVIPLERLDDMLNRAFAAGRVGGDGAALGVNVNYQYMGPAVDERGMAEELSQLIGVGVRFAAG